jgi:Flp pilus assembly protein TadB
MANSPGSRPPALAVTPIELAIYASEMKLLLIGLASLAAIFFAAALLFAFFFGTVNPRLRRAYRRCKRLKTEGESLRSANRALKADLANGAARIVALENTSGLLEKEVHRLDGIRKRTDSSLVETKALLERLQTVTAHVDMP